MTQQEKQTTWAEMVKLSARQDELAGELSRTPSQYQSSKDRVNEINAIQWRIDRLAARLYASE